MFTGIITIAIIGLLGILTHRRTRLQEKVLKHIPLTDWITVLILPVSLYIGWIILVKNILERPKVPIFPMDDFDILAVTFIFMVYGMVGNSIHFTGKILWRYLEGYENTMAYRVNEMFHGKLSHYLAFLNGFFVGFMLPILEINHPAIIPISLFYMIIIILTGSVFGVCVCKGIFYTNQWFGGYNKPLFFIGTTLFLSLLVILKTYRLSFTYYPVSLFIVSMFVSGIITFASRQIFIFAHLGKRRRLHFLAKILSA